MKFLRIILTLIIFIAAALGDYIVFKSKYSEYQVFRASSDSIVHATIGFSSALLFFSYKLNINTQACVYNTIFCTIISSLIDIDHVFAAKSFYLKDLTNLKHRGIFHCTSFWILLTTVLFIYSYVAKRFNIFVLNFMLILAFTSHHIRDGNRRGLWLYPFGHTTALSKHLYIFLVGVLPHVFAFIFTYIKGGLVKNTVVDYVLV